MGLLAAGLAATALLHVGAADAKVIFEKSSAKKVSQQLWDPCTQLHCVKRAAWFLMPPHDSIAHLQLWGPSLCHSAAALPLWVTIAAGRMHKAGGSMLSTKCVTGEVPPPDHACSCSK